MRPANTVQNKWSPLAPPSHHLTPKASLVIPNSSQVSLASQCWSWLPDVSQGQGQGAQMGWVSKVHAWITYKSEKRGAGLWTALHTEAEAHRKQEEVQPKAKGQGDHGESLSPRPVAWAPRAKPRGLHLLDAHLDWILENGWGGALGRSAVRYHDEKTKQKYSCWFGKNLQRSSKSNPLPFNCLLKC